MNESGFLGGGIGPTAIKRRSGLAAPVPVAGPELLTNGDFSSWTGDNPTDWGISGTETGTTYISESAGRCRLVTDGPIIAMSQNVLTAGAWYTTTVDVAAASGFVGWLFGGTNPIINYFASGARFAAGRAADATFQVKRAGGACDAIFDNITCRALTLASLFSTHPYASANCDLSAAITRTAGTQAGLVARLDSATSPANFIIAYLDGVGNVKVDKCVAGTYTNVISGAVTYSAGKVLRLVCSGNSVSAYYDGAQVGSTVTVSDAGIVSNTRHGLFSTYAANSFAGYVAA